MLEGRGQARHFEVWPENWPAWQAFSSVQTQWATGFAGATGLDYARVRSGLEMAGIDVTPDLFAKLRIVESAVLEHRATEQRTK